MATFEIEFADDSAPQQRRTAPLKKLYENNSNGSDVTGQAGYNSRNQVFSDTFGGEKKQTSYEYNFDDIDNGNNDNIDNIDINNNNRNDGQKSAKILIKCKVEDWNKSFSLFADFLRDAKKYYKKTCLNAKFVYFFSYRPMYRELNHEQLCWYLFWRSRIRDGEYIKTGLSYIFLYLYEQINLSDIIGHEKVYENIIKIWKNYRAEFPRMDKYAAEWLIDFAFINKMKPNLDHIDDILPGILNFVTIPEVYMKDDFFKNKKNISVIIKNMSAYDYTKSKFYTDKNKELLDYHVEQIVREVVSSENFNEIIKTELNDGVIVKATRESFMGAVCVYDYKKKITVEYKNLYKNFFVRACVTDTVRYAENVIRDYLGIKSKLTISTLPEPLKSIIEEYKSKYLTVAKPQKITVKSNKSKAKKANSAFETEPESEPMEFNPNIQTAAEIEKSSWDTTMTLVELQTRDSKTINEKNENSEFAGGESLHSQESDEIEEIESLTSFEDSDELDEDDGEFITIDTGDPEDYAAVEEIAPKLPYAREVSATPNEEVYKDEEDIFDVLENLENAEFAELADVIEAEHDNTSKDLIDLIDLSNLSDMGRFIANLTGDEFLAVEMLINADISGKSFDMLCGDFLSRTGAMLESVIDTMNEKSLDFTGDIIFDTASHEIIEDYRDEIKKHLENTKQ